MVTELTHHSDKEKQCPEQVNHQQPAQRNSPGTLAIHYHKKQSYNHCHSHNPML